MTTEEINAGLQIVKLEGQKFSAPNGYYQPRGFALYHPAFGYFAFEGDHPYIPAGGRKALKAILNSGGMVDFKNCVWLKEIN